ncbi:MAG: methyl-accepting chemotaxis protein [Negativicutes bacterium]|nr:methyl-accepting chemotaxis protein [Negativicutes bacterium]
MNLMTKMLAYFLLVVLVTLGGFVYTIWKVSEVSVLAEDVNKQFLPRLIKVSQINSNASDKVAYLREYFITGDKARFDDYKKATDENSRIEQELIGAALTGKGKTLVTEVKALDDTFSELVEKKFAPLMAAGQREEARRVLLGEMQPAYKALDQKMNEYQEYMNKRSTDALSQAVEYAASARTAAIVAAVFAAFLSIVIAVFAARSISRPVNRLAAVAEKVASGDLTEQVQVDSRDEIGQLATAFNTMTGQLKGLIRHITINAEQVAAASQQLTASSEQSAQAANQITISITDVAAGANEQLDAANETSAVVEQMSAGVQQMAASANQVAAQSAQAADTATSGGKAVEKAVSQMAQIESTVNDSAAVVAKLGDRSKEIGQIVDTISGIAGQTNLLALNAAIEAARAGEQGRGFAVVAEEVRKLAEQSQDAAKKIAELIGEIQGDTDKAVVAMNDGTREVKTGAEVVNAAGAAFREIAALVNQVSEQVGDISAAIQQTAAGSQQIVGSVKKIDQLSKKSAGEAQSVSAATEEQLASMEEIATSSEALAKLSQELQAAVSRFRV